MKFIQPSLAGLRVGLCRLLALLVMVGTSAVHAGVVLILSPQAQTVELGGVASVDVIASGLSGQRIGAYDFFVNFDDGILDLLSVDVSPSLGGPFDSLLFATPEAGRVNVAEISLLAGLGGLQSGNGDLLLFTLRFSTAALGISPLSLSENILGIANGFLGDEIGEVITLSGTGEGSITVVSATPPPPPVEPPAQPVPEPTSLMLASLALVAAGVQRRLIRKSQKS